MNGRMLLKWPLVLALVFGMLFGASNDAYAQTASPTQNTVSCVDGAANELKQCVDDLPWYAEALCYSRYASDGVLCLPSMIIRAV
jgi:hypothetical protein